MKPGRPDKLIINITTSWPGLWSGCSPKSLGTRAVVPFKNCIHDAHWSGRPPSGQLPAHFADELVHHPLNERLLDVRRVSAGRTLDLPVGLSSRTGRRRNSSSTSRASVPSISITSSRRTGEVPTRRAEHAGRVRKVMATASSSLPCEFRAGDAADVGQRAEEEVEQVERVAAEVEQQAAAGMDRVEPPLVALRRPKQPGVAVDRRRHRARARRRRSAPLPSGTAAAAGGSRRRTAATPPLAERLDHPHALGVVRAIGFST